ncbi:acylneuraminate cytidylyltransferase family protein [Vibrio breoganii]
MIQDTIALIPARGGSKGLPRKNVLTLLDKPLVAWTIEAALSAKSIDRVFVSSDDEEILDVSIEAGADVFKRPGRYASDKASSDSVILHAIEYFGSKGIYPKTIVLLQPTSPLRGATHIDEALFEFHSNIANLVISVFEPHHTPVKSYIQREDGSITGLYSESAPYCRRQDLPIAFQPNGAIYVIDVKAFLELKAFPRSKVYPYKMSTDFSLDIDTQDDFDRVAKVLKKNEEL